MRSLLLAALLSAPALAAEKPSAPFPIEPQAAADLASKKKAVLVDVREYKERAEVVPGTDWEAFSTLANPDTWRRLKLKLDKNKTIVFFCRSGRRAKLAAEKLAAEGYKTAYFDGPEQWKAAGLPLEKRPAR